MSLHGFMRRILREEHVGLRAIAAITLIAMSTCQAMAETYKSNPAGTLKLGAGVNPSALTRAYPSCIVDPDQPLPSNQAVGVPATQFSSQILSSYEDVYNAFDLDASLSASYLFTSGEADFHLADSSALHTDSFSWTLKASSDYGWTSLSKDFGLDSKYQPLIHDADQFYAQCGTEYVQTERRIAQVIAIFTAHHLSKSQRDDLSGSFSVGVGGPVGDLSANSDGRQ